MNPFIIRTSQLQALAVGRRRREAAEALGRAGFQVVEDPIDGSLILADAEDRRGRLAFGDDGSTRLESGGAPVLTSWRDPFGRLARLESPGGASIDVREDDRSGSMEIRRGGGGMFRLRQDPEGRPIEIGYPDGTTVRFEERPDGRRVIHRDGATTEFVRDADGRTTAVVNPRGHATRIEHGPSSRRFHYPDGTVHEYGLGEDGELESWRIDGRLHAAYRLADDAPRLEATYADGHRVSLAYEGDRLTEATNPLGVLRLEYDDAGRLVREDWNGRAVEYIRDGTGLLAGIATPDGETLRFLRDARARVDRVVDWSGAQTRLGYAAHGPMDRIVFPNGVEARSTFDEIGRCTATRTTSPASTSPLVDAAYTHDPCDRVVSAHGPKASRRFEYDAEGRLVRVKAADSDVRYQFDPMGNAVRAGTSTRAYDPLDRLATIDGSQVAYDELGGVASGPTPKGPARFRYNGQGQLVEVALADGTTARYAYDPIGRRVRKMVGETVTEYTWAGALLLSEKTLVPDGESRRDHLFLPGTFQPLAMRVEGRIYRHHLDGSGFPSSMTDDEGREVWSAVLDPYGEARILVEEVENPWRLPGQTYDPETGLHYNLARYYHPAWGRYLTPDPLRSDGGGLNYYVYAQADPINKADPTGEIVPLVLAGAAIGAAAAAGLEYYRQRNAIEDGSQSQADWDAIETQALLGGLIGSIGSAVGVAAGGATMAAAGANSLRALVIGGAVEGAASSVAETCSEAALTGEPVNSSALLLGTVVGAGGGALTLGKGGAAAGKAARGAAKKAGTGRRSISKAVREAGRAAARKKNIIFGELDELGRATGVKAVITPEMIGTGSSAASRIRPPGFKGASERHARGHLLGNQLGGAGNDKRNLVPLFQNPANHPEMSSFERQVRKAVEGGEVVEYTAVPIYRGSDPVPIGVTLTAKGDKGFHIHSTVLNRPYPAGRKSPKKRGKPKK